MQNKYLVLAGLILLLNACGAPKPFYNKAEKDWENKKMPENPVKYSVFLLGDLVDKADTSHSVLKMLQVHTTGNDTSHAMIFMSDDFANKKLSVKNENLNSALEFIKDDNGKIFFISGAASKDEYEGPDKESVNYVEKILGKENIFYPKNGCPGPDEILLTDDLLLVPLNTAFWLRDEDDIKSDCDIDKEDDWIDNIKDVVDNNQRKNMLILGHHPLLDLGNHGGFFSLKQHIFPFTDLNPNLYIPLPVVGTLYPVVRGGFGLRNDKNYPSYKRIRRKLLKTFDGFNNVVYASGLENNFQYFKYNKQDYIITNSSSDIDWVGKNKRAPFTYAEKGFVKLSYLQNGEVWMEFFSPDKNSDKGKVVYRKRLKDNQYGKPGDSTAISPSVEVADSTITIAADKNLGASNLKKIFLGAQYRDAWTTPVTVPLLDLQTEQGGLEIIKKGGGFQTKSLQLRNKKGEELSLRSVNKYPERLLGNLMTNTLAAEIVKDQSTSTHPYAPYVVAELSESAGILHTEPRMVFIPNDKQLKEYTNDFANTLALFEKKGDGKMKPSENLDYATKAVSSSKLLKNMKEDNKIVIDDYSLLKSRLFDMWINDWDRHEGQWRWGLVECDDQNSSRCSTLNADKEFYVPIPKDRDQAFAKFEGILPWIAGRKWAVRKFQNFKDDIRDVPGLNFNARNFDHAFLSRLSREDWDRIALELKRELTDEKIEKSIRTFPDPIFKLDGDEIISKLKSRRDKLPSFATEYYDYLSQFVDVRGSDKKEIFEINRISDDSTTIKMYDSEKGEKGKLLYERTFITGDTKEVRIYGMGEEDIFDLSGKVDNSVLIRIIGGSGKDSIVDKSNVSGWCRKTKIYDTEDKTFISGKEARDLTSDSEDVNDYNYSSYKYNVVAPATFFGYNVDDGLFLGGGVLIKRYGFRKKPYSYSQRLVANVALRETSFNLRYNGDFVNVIGQWGIVADVSVLAPRSTTNFFGLGNETVRLQDEDEYYRLRYDDVTVFTGLKRQFLKYHSVKIGPAYKFLKIDNTPGRFISSVEGIPYFNNFKTNHFGGAKFEYEFQYINDSVLTFRGIKWISSATSQTDIKDESGTSLNVESQLCVYVPLGNRSTLAVRAGGAKRFGDFEFYQANTLGGQNAKRDHGNLRGYLRGRYAGRSVAYLNTDLRIKLFSFKTYLFPAHFGLHGFYDQGRVWVDKEKSSLWHNSYGGGIWIDPFAMVVINFTYAVSKEEKLFSVGTGFLF